MDVFGILILLWSLALITFSQILFASTLRLLFLITRGRKSITQAIFLSCNILRCSLVTWNLAVSAILAKGWGWKMYWPIFAFTCGLTCCLIYAIFHYIPPPPISESRQLFDQDLNSRHLKLGLFDHDLNPCRSIKVLLDHINPCMSIKVLLDHINPHLKVLKGLFNYFNPRCRRPENANVDPSHVESPKTFWRSAIWLALIKPENIGYTILSVSMCLLLWTVTFFDMLTMSSGWQRIVWWSFLTTCQTMAPMIFMVYMDDNSRQPMISPTGPVKGLFDRLNPSLVKGDGLFNHININPRSAEDATVFSSHLMDLSPAATESPRKFWSAFLLPENIACMIFMGNLSVLSWCVTNLIAMLTANSGWEKVWSSCAVTFGGIFIIYAQGQFDHHRSRRLTENANVVAPSQLTDLSPAAVESPNVIPDVHSEKGECKAIKQEEVVDMVESNEKSKCQHNKTDVDNGWEIIQEAEIK